MKLCLLFPGTRDLISNNNKENTVYHFHLRFLPLSLRRWVGCMLLSQSHYAARLCTFQPSFHKSRESWSGRGIALERERERKRRSRFREEAAFYSGRARRWAKQSADANRRWFTIYRPARVRRWLLAIPVPESWKLAFFIAVFHSSPVRPVISINR